MLLVVLFFVVAYSLKGLRFKERPFIDSITSSLHFVGPLLFAYTLFDAPPVAWLIVGAFFLWGVASHAFGAVQDIIPDRSAGLRSVATFLGARRTVWLAFGFYIGSAMTLFVGAHMQVIFAAIIVLVYAANVAPYLSATDETSGSTNRGWRRFLALNYIAGAAVTFLCIFSYA